MRINQIVYIFCKHIPSTIPCLSIKYKFFADIFSYFSHSASTPRRPCGTRYWQAATGAGSVWSSRCVWNPLCTSSCPHAFHLPPACSWLSAVPGGLILWSACRGVRRGARLNWWMAGARGDAWLQPLSQIVSATCTTAYCWPEGGGNQTTPLPPHLNLPRLHPPHLLSIRPAGWEHGTETMTAGDESVHWG